MILVNGQAENRIEVIDRGLQYGDGLFETLAYRQGKLEFLEAHLQRLHNDCKRLNIPFHQTEELRAELAQVCDALSENAVVKIIITRGVGGRGYFASQDIIPTRIVSTHPYPVYPDSYPIEGVTVRLCQHRLGENAALAGIKHLNRLDQVLARNEWTESDIAEGFMCDQHDNLIEGTMSNLFIVKSGELLTPELSKSGVAGIMRAQIIQLAKANKLSVNETSLTQLDLNQADEAFLCNSINGIWPINHVIDTKQHYSVGPITKRCQQLLAEAVK
jgi:4-amino-4-deoxychorismate lyase